jgi:Holliday junction resolvasome RuvABC ATP-dependent DNA helicase subunit
VEKVLILGEAKTSLSRREVNKFMKHVKLVSSLEDVDEGHVIIVGVIHTVTPDVEECACEKGIKLYWSYDI